MWGQFWDRAGPWPITLKSQKPRKIRQKREIGPRKTAQVELRGYPGSYAAFCCGYLNGATGRFRSGASRRNMPRIALIRTHASLDCGARS